jgi:hypothetical protein
VKAASRLNAVARQRPVHLGQSRPDEILLGGVLTRECKAGNPCQQRQPVITGIDDEMPANSRDGRPGWYACLLKPLRHGHAPGELDAITRRYRLGEPSPVAKIDEPGLGAHATVVHRDPNALQVPVTPQRGDQRCLSDHRLSQPE